MHANTTRHLERGDATDEQHTTTQSENDSGLDEELLADLRAALNAYLEDRPDGHTLRTVREDGDVVAVIYELGTTKRIESDEEAREALDTLRTAGYGGEA
jgi:hypothetical protein